MPEPPTFKDLPLENEWVDYSEEQDKLRLRPINVKVRVDDLRAGVIKLVRYHKEAADRLTDDTAELELCAIDRAVHLTIASAFMRFFNLSEEDIK